MRLIIVRNGETLWEKEHRLQGIQDNPLSDDGKKQVEFLANALKNEQIDAVYCSDLGRCIDSARPIAKSHNLKLGIRTELRQRSHGIVEGMMQKEADKEYPKLQEQRKQSKFQFRNPKGESYADAEKRLLPFLEEIKQKHASQTVCIVTHGGICRLVIGNFLGLKPHEVIEIDIPHDCIYFVESAEQSPQAYYAIGGQKKEGFLKKQEQPEEEASVEEEVGEEAIEKEADKDFEGEEPFVEGEELIIEEEPPSFKDEEQSAESKAQEDSESGKEAEKPEEKISEDAASGLKETEIKEGKKKEKKETGEGALEEQPAVQASEEPEEEPEKDDNTVSPE